MQMLNYTGQYMVTAFLSTTPHSPSAPGEELLPVSSLTTSVVNGRALFQNLYINKAGYPYVISFSINKVADLRAVLLFQLIFLCFLFI